MRVRWRKITGRKWITQKGVRLCYPTLLASGSRSEIRQRRGTTWFRIPLDAFTPLGQLKGNDLTGLHLLVIEGKWEALLEFQFQKYIVHGAVVKVNTASRGRPSLITELGDTSNIWGADACTDSGVTKNEPGRNRKTNLLQRSVCVLVPVLSSIFSLA